jgi:type VI secretion system protein ImpF
MSTAKIQAPLLHRLTDESIEQLIDTDKGRYIHFEDLQIEIKSNLENILNARPFYFGAHKNLTELNNSVLNYGIPDFSQQYYHLKKHQKELCQVIRAVISHFEPRLQKTMVSLVENQEKNVRTLTIRITGVIVVKPEIHQAVFESNLDVIRYQFTFQD